MCIIIPGDVVAHTSGQQCPEHVRKREEQQSATTEGVDGPNSRPSEQEVNKTETERGNQSFSLCRSTLLEDSG